MEINISDYINPTTIFSFAACVGGSYLALSKWQIMTDNKLVAFDEKITSNKDGIDKELYGIKVDIKDLEHSQKNIENLNISMKVLERDVEYLKNSNENLSKNIQKIQEHTHSLKGSMSSLENYFTQYFNKNV